MTRLALSWRIGNVPMSAFWEIVERRMTWFDKNGGAVLVEDIATCR
jgi:hypothetical protein